jgi:hypothetical protein
VRNGDPAVSRHISREGREKRTPVEKRWNIKHPVSFCFWGTVLSRSCATSNAAPKTPRMPPLAEWNAKMRENDKMAMTAETSQAERVGVRVEKGSQPFHRPRHPLPPV